MAGIVVELPFLSRPVCLPILARLWRPRRTGKIAYAREMAELIAARYPDRRVHVVGDAAYVWVNTSRGLDSQITWTSRLKVTSVLHELPPPRTGPSGRPRTKGARLGTATDVATIAAARAMWRDARVRRYGRTDAVQITEVALDELDMRDPQTMVSVARLRQDCVLAKETLSVDTETTIPVLLPGRHFDVKISRSDFDNLVRAQIESTIGALSQTLRSAQVSPDDLSAVLLVGGSSRTRWWRAWLRVDGTGGTGDARSL